MLVIHRCNITIKMYSRDYVLATFNEVVANMRIFGKYNIKKMVLLLFPLLMSGTFYFIFMFTAGDTEYRCKVGECENYYNTNWTHYAIPQTINGKLDKCSRFATNDHSAQGVEVCSREWFDNKSIVSCDEYAYYGPENTLTKQFNLGCQEWKRTLVGTVRGISLIISLVLCGVLSDRYGRKRILIIYSILIGLLGLIRSYSPSYEIFIILEFFDGMVSGGGLLVSIATLLMEMVTPRGRIIIQFIIPIMVCIGSLLTTVMAWAVKDWKMLLRILQLPIMLTISYIWFIDESVRWLISNGKEREAMDILKNAVRFNYDERSVPESLKNLYHGVDNTMIAEETQHLNPKTPMESEQIIKIPPVELQAENNSKEVSMKQMLRSPKLRLRLFMSAIIWIFMHLVLNGFEIYGIQYLPGNKYWNFVYLIIVDPFTLMISTYAIFRFGRKKIMAGLFILCSVCCFIIITLPKTWSTVLVCLYLISKSAMKACSASMFQYTGEIFPTNLRSTLMGAGLTLGNIGFIIATQVPLLAQYWESLPVIIFGIITLFVTLALIPIPETVDVKLPDTIKEAEDM